MKTDSRVDLLRSMLRIRRVEETLADLYPSQEMRTPTHFSIGQEAVAVGVCAALRRDDIVYSGHRSVRPLDEEIILRSLRKTGHLVVADSSWALCGVSAEVAAIAAEKGWHHLKAPVRRVTPPDCPAPVSKPLEDAFHPNPLAITQACLDVLKAGTLETGLADVQATFAGPY